MTDDKREIEKRLKALIDVSSAPPRCTSKIFKVMSIIGFLVFLGSAVLCFMAWRNWQVAKDDKMRYTEELKYNNRELGRTEEDAKTLRVLLSETVAELEKVEKDVNSAKADNDALKKKIEVLKANIANATTTYRTIGAKRDELKTKNDQLSAEDKTLTEELNKVSARAKELNVTYQSETTALNAWKIGSCIGLGVLVAEGMESAWAHSRYWRLLLEQQPAEQLKAAFPKVSAGFEDYTFLTRSNGGSVSRTTCFHNGGKQDLQSCTNAYPTLTTVTTKTGFRFSVLLTIPWRVDNGHYADEGSLGISANHGAAAKIRAEDKEYAIIVDNNSLFNFGRDNIVISTDGKTGTARASSYSIPTEYNNENFFLTGTSFEVSDIKVERLILA